MTKYGTEAGPISGSVWAHRAFTIYCGTKGVKLQTRTEIHGLSIKLKASRCECISVGTWNGRRGFKLVWTGLSFIIPWRFRRACKLIDLLPMLMDSEAQHWMGHPKQET